MNSRQNKNKLYKNKASPKIIIMVKIKTIYQKLMKMNPKNFIYKMLKLKIQENIQKELNNKMNTASRKWRRVKVIKNHPKNYIQQKTFQKLILMH